MKRIIFIVTVLLLAGCSTVKVDVVKKDGTTCHAERQAFFMTSSAIQGEACGGSIGASSSKADTEALAAVVSAAIAAARVVP